MSEHIILPRNNSNLHTWLSGPTDGRLIALSHGAAMDHRMFDPQLELLVSAGYRVLTWDIRGHGRSQPLGRRPITVRDMTDDLMAILEHLGVAQPICIGGQSLGGYIAQDFVRRHPERTAAVVIVGSTCTTMPIPRWEDWALRSTPWWIRAWPWNHLKRTVASATAVRPDVRCYALGAVAQMRKADFVEIWRGVAHSINPAPAYRIEQPILLTHGAQDGTGNIARAAPAWAARDPQCRFEVIPDAGHNANQDNAEFFNRVLAEFLTAHYPSTPR